MSTDMEKEPEPIQKESFLQRKRTTKEILIMITVMFLVLFLMLTVIIPRAQSTFRGPALAWTHDTQSLLPIGKTIGLQSVTSGKFLQVIPKDQAIPNCDQVASGNLFLEASGADKSDASTQWVVEGPSENQKKQYSNYSIRLKNLKTNTYLTESVNGVDDFPAFSWGAETSPSPEGSPIGSAMFVTRSEKKNPNEVLIIGADIANNEHGKVGELINEDSPFFLTSDRKGRILAPSKVPLNRESVWLVHFI